VTRFAVLLRGVNVGGRNRLPMADLRAALAADDLDEVQTYLQSGNVVASSSSVDPEVVAAMVRARIARDFGLDVPAIALTADDLVDIVRVNPFTDEPDPKKVHAIVLPHAPTAEAISAVDECQEAAASLGSRDRVTLVGRVAYLHTPDGFGRSDLARRLTSGRSAALADGTARNWATVTALTAIAA